MNTSHAKPSFTYFFNKIKRIIDNRFYYTDPLVVTFGIFGLINYPIFYLVWHFIFKVEYTNLLMRFTATLFCVGLALSKYWPQRLKTYLPMYWYAAVIYCLPFFGTYMFIKNHGSMIWQTNIMLVLFWLILSVDWVSFVIILPIGVILASVYYELTIGSIFIFEGNIIPTLSNYLWAVVIAAVFSRNREYLQLRKQLRALKALGASIAHELRTPLSTINAAARGAGDIMPKLISSYQMAEQSDLPVPNIRPSRLAGVSDTLDDIQAETRHAHTIIDMLLMKVNDPDLNNFATGLCSIKHVVNEALHRYPLTLEQQQWIHVQDDKDFFFKGNELLMMHVLFNLIKNAIYYVRASGKGNIHIWIDQGKRYNRLHFKDTGQGIPPKVLPHIFDRFYSDTENGTGLGLAFCKLVMHSFNGDIRCYSKLGQYTEFVMRFPILKGHDKETPPICDIDTTRQAA